MNTLEKLQEASRLNSEYIKRLEHDLAECYKLTGADPDGNEDWRLASRAVEEVRAMRRELDVLEDEHAECEERLFQAT